MCAHVRNSKSESTHQAQNNIFPTARQSPFNRKGRSQPYEELTIFPLAWRRVAFVDSPSHFSHALPPRLAVMPSSGPDVIERTESRQFAAMVCTQAAHQRGWNHGWTAVASLSILLGGSLVSGAHERTPPAPEAFYSTHADCPGRSLLAHIAQRSLHPRVIPPPILTTLTGLWLPLLAKSGRWIERPKSRPAKESSWFRPHVRPTRVRRWCERPVSANPKRRQKRQRWSLFLYRCHRGRCRRCPYRRKRRQIRKPTPTAAVAA